LRYAKSRKAAINPALGNDATRVELRGSVEW
jgi:hypothetical protein